MYFVVFHYLNFIIHLSKLDVFQYLTDVEVNTTITDDLVSEVCHTTVQINYVLILLIAFITSSLNMCHVCLLNFTNLFSFLLLGLYPTNMSIVLASKIILD